MWNFAQKLAGALQQRKPLLQGFWWKHGGQLAVLSFRRWRSDSFNTPPEGQHHFIKNMMTLFFHITYTKRAWRIVFCKSEPPRSFFGGETFLGSRRELALHCSRHPSVYKLFPNCESSCFCPRAHSPSCIVSYFTASLKNRTDVHPKMPRRGWYSSCKKKKRSLETFFWLYIKRAPPGPR